jgi:hypothetical protein
LLDAFARFAYRLVSCSRNPLINSDVIPANPGSQSGVARAGIQEFQRFWMPAFAGMTVRAVMNSLTNFGDRTLAVLSMRLAYAELLVIRQIFHSIHRLGR